MAGLKIILIDKLNYSSHLIGADTRDGLFVFDVASYMCDERSQHGEAQSIMRAVNSAKCEQFKVGLKSSG